MKNPNFTADSIEKFNELVEFFNSLPEKIKINISSLAYTSFKQYFVKMRLCDHPSNRDKKAIYMPPNTNTTSIEKNLVQFHSDKFLFEIELSDLDQFQILHEKWL